MIYSVSCSFGEIIDKLTILEIKIDKCICETQQKNIQNEYDQLRKHMMTDDDFIRLYKELKHINNTLWDYEDQIRIKSKHKEYDNAYILISEGIHLYNDKRYELKKRINKAYNSYIIEEKMYSI